jgi:Na+/H+ antiporter NhaC
MNWYGPSQLEVKVFFFPGFFILTIVSSATKPSKVYLPFLVA